MSACENVQSKWCKGAGWGWIWGSEDEIGALNALSTESVLAALAAVRQGRVFDLGVTINRGSFLFSGHAPTQVVSYRTPDGLVRGGDLPGFENPSGTSFNTSMLLLSDHAGTQIDGLCHATYGRDRHWYNGYDADRHGTDFGPTRAGAENIPPIITRGVLIDVPNALALDELPAGFGVEPALLQQALDIQRVDIRPGQAVFIRSGCMRHWGETGQDHAAIAAPDSAGITLAAARWLVEEKGAVLVASDTSTVEVTPSLDGDCSSPVHKYLLVDQGVHMGELHYLEDLAAEDVYEFTYIALAPKVEGATAGFAMRPVAVI